MAVWPEFQHLPAVMPVGRQPVGDDHGSGRIVQSRLDVVEAEDGADGRHIERPVAERDPARHPQPRCDFAHALAAPVTVFVGHCEDASFPAGADEKGAFLAPGHLPCIGDFREGLDDEALREMDGGEAIILDRPDRAEESGGEKQGQDESSHDPTHMWEARRLPNLPRQAGNIPASSQSKRDQRKHLPEGWCLPRPSSEESAPTRIFQVPDAVRTRRTTLGRSTAARPRR